MPVDIAGTILEGGRQRAATMLKLADLAAQSRAQSGQIWGSTVANIGHDVSQMFDPARRQAAEVGRMKVEEAKSQAEDKAALAQAFKVGHTKDEVLQLLRASPHSADLIPKVQEMYDAADQRAATLGELKRKAALAEANHLGSLAASVDVWKNDPQSQMFVFDAGLQSALDSGLYDPKQIQQIQQQVHANPQLLSGMIAKLISQSPEQTELATKRATEARTAAKDAREASLFGPQLIKARADADVAEQQAAGTVGGITPQQQVQNAATAARDAALVTHQKALEKAAMARIAAGTSSDQGEAKAIADAIISGDQPPVLTGLYRFAAPVRAELSKQGYDLSAALSDWNATQRYLSSLNSTQQVRLRQAVDLSSHSLDIIDDLASQWKGGAFPPLNKANLFAAKNGAYGKEVASVATNLVAQIADLTSELGTVYKGGNGSTDESLKLAAENLSADWDEYVLKNAIKMVRKNLTIRNNSIKNGAPITLSGGANEYAGGGAGGGPGRGGVTVLDKNGKSWTFPNQAAADQFKAEGH